MRNGRCWRSDGFPTQPDRDFLLFVGRVLSLRGRILLDRSGKPWERRQHVVFGVIVLQHRLIRHSEQSEVESRENVLYEEVEIMDGWMMDGRFHLLLCGFT